MHENDYTFGKVLKYTILIGGLALVGYLIYSGNNKTNENVEQSKLERKIDTLYSQKDSLKNQINNSKVSQN